MKSSDSPNLVLSQEKKIFQSPEKFSNFNSSSILQKKSSKFSVSNILKANVESTPLPLRSTTKSREMIKKTLDQQIPSSETKPFVSLQSLVNKDSKNMDLVRELELKSAHLETIKSQHDESNRLLNVAEASLVEKNQELQMIKLRLHSQLQALNQALSNLSIRLSRQQQQTHHHHQPNSPTPSTSPFASSPFSRYERTHFPSSPSSTSSSSSSLLFHSSPFHSNHHHHKYDPQQQPQEEEEEEEEEEYDDEYEDGYEDEDREDEGRYQQREEEQELEGGEGTCPITTHLTPFTSTTSSMSSMNDDTFSLSINDSSSSSSSSSSSTSLSSSSSFSFSIVPPPPLFLRNRTLSLASNTSQSSDYSSSSPSPSPLSSPSHSRSSSPFY